MLARSALAVFVPHAELLVRRVEVEVVALAAAPDTTFVGAGSVTTTVLQHAGVPLQTQGVAAGAGFPRVTGGAAALLAWTF